MILRMIVNFLSTKEDSCVLSCTCFVSRFILAYCFLLILLLSQCCCVSVLSLVCMCVFVCLTLYGNLKILSTLGRGRASLSSFFHLFFFFRVCLSIIHTITMRVGFFDIFLILYLLCISIEGKQ